MKYISKMFYLVLLALALQSCTDKEDAAPSKEQLQFSLNVNSVPDGATLRVSIQKKSGESVFELKSLELQKDASGFISEPVELLTGNYVITDFLVVSKDNKIFYATPKKGSAMAAKVTNPVERELLVSKGTAPSVAMEVLNVANALPENFGYTTFNLNVIHPLKVTVSVPYLGGEKLTTGQAYILEGADTVQKFNIGPKVNVLPFQEEPDHTVTLVIVKDGYAVYSNDFIYNSLIGTLGSGALKITLTPAFTFLAYANDDRSLEFSFNLGGVGTDKNLVINWGDGLIENYLLGSSYSVSHEYPSVGDYPVTITGDLEAITYFKSFYGFGEIDKINFQNLPNLNEVIFGLSRSPEVLDFTYNSKLTTLNLPGLNDVKTVTLPTTSKISYVGVDGYSQLTSSSLNDIITKLYNTAVKNKTRNGGFSYAKSWYQDENDQATVATPSPAALNMLHTLRDSYGWYVWPDK